MARTFHNIESKRSPGGHYVGYANGPWHIHGGGKSVYAAYPQPNQKGGVVFTAKTLQEVSIKLDEFAKAK